MTRTPGDWFASGAAVFDAVGNCIGNCETDNATPERYAANARLMAMAPRLLKALDYYVNQHPAFRVRPMGAPGSAVRQMQDFAIEQENEARAAIAEAGGAR